MAFFERFITYRDEFTFITGCAGRFGEPFYFRWPEKILLAGFQALNPGFYMVVGLEGNILLKFLDAHFFMIAIHFTPFRVR